MSARSFSRPEVGVFQQLMLSLGAKETDCDGKGGGGPISAFTFALDTSDADTVQVVMNDQGPEYGGLNCDVWMYPEDELRDATPQQMAATIARWLRDTAAKLEAAA